MEKAVLYLSCYFNHATRVCTLRAGGEKGCDRERKGREVRRKLQVAGINQAVESVH